MGMPWGESLDGCKGDDVSSLSTHVAEQLRGGLAGSLEDQGICFLSFTNIRVLSEHIYLLVTGS